MNLTEDTFDELFKPQQNHLDDNASWSGQMYETFGAELEYVLSLTNDLRTHNRVWTILEADGKQYVSADYHRINRIGYIITEIPWVTGTEEFEVEGVDSDIPTYFFNRDDYSEQFWSDHGGTKDNETIQVSHSELCISVYGDLEKFLLDDAMTSNEMDETIRELIPNKCVFEFKGDDEGLGFILDIWHDEHDKNEGDVWKTSCLWFDDFQPMTRQDLEDKLTIDLFNLCIRHGLIDEDAEFDDYMNDRTDMFDDLCDYYEV